jgi:hypothetical protein
MVEENQSNTSQDYFQKEVNKWIEDNYAVFKEGGEQNGKILYRSTIVKRCKKYDSASDEYLRTMLKLFPEIMKWYLNVFQGVFLVGLVGFETTLLVLFSNNFAPWFQKLSNIDWSIFLSQSKFESWLQKLSILDWYSTVIWFVPLALFIVILAALKTNRKSESSYLSHFIQTTFWIVKNLKDTEIEMYYISKILEKRELDKRHVPNCME